jgi:hypothetical protein
MSAIDQYRFTCLGVVACPSPYKVIYRSEKPGAQIPIYHLEEDIPDEETDFQGRRGDILVGGGSGEVEAMRIHKPAALLFYTSFKNFPQDDHLPVTETYWSPTNTYKMCQRYELLGWNADEATIEGWLTEHVLQFVLNHYPDWFEQYAGKTKLERNSSICRLLSAKEEKMLNWRRYRTGE